MTLYFESIQQMLSNFIKKTVSIVNSSRGKNVDKGFDCVRGKIVTNYINSAEIQVCQNCKYFINNNHINNYNKDVYIAINTTNNNFIFIIDVYIAMNTN